MTQALLESVIDMLAAKNLYLILIKVDEGYAAIVIDTETYIQLNGKEHYNASTMEGVLEFVRNIYGDNRY